MAKKNITIDDLATMVQKGFNEVTKEMATKKEMNFRFEQVDKRFDAIDRRFDKIENLILENHKRRIEKLEEEIKELRELFAM